VKGRREGSSGPPGLTRKSAEKSDAALREASRAHGVSGRAVASTAPRKGNMDGQTGERLSAEAWTMAEKKAQDLSCFVPHPDLRDEWEVACDSPMERSQSRHGPN